MGNVCSGSGMSKHVNVPRDPADKELDEIEMKETKIADFDSFFASAAEPLNQMVELHNSIAQSEENLKAAAAAIQGEAQVRLLASHSGRVSLELWKFDDKEEEYVFSAQELDDKVSSDPALRDAYEKTDHAMTNLNVALEQAAEIQASEYTVKHGRLFITRKGGDHDAFIRDVNVALFSFRKQLMMNAHIASLGEAVKIFIGELAKVEDVGALSVETDEETGATKVMCGDEELDLRKMDKLSKPALQLRDALVELLDNIQTAAMSLPALAEQSAAFNEEAQAFPGKVPDAITDSGLGITEIPKAASATTTNVKALGNAPKVAKATTMMVQYAGRELQQAVSIPHGG